VEESTQGSSAPRISQFNQILLWPLVMEGVTRDVFFSMLENLPKHGWRQEGIFTVHDQQPDKTEQEKTNYATFVYFHPFVQQLLTSTGEQKPDSAVRRYVRQDIKHAEVRLDIDEKIGREDFVCEVKQLELWAFDTHIVILVLEVSIQDNEGLSIVEVEAFQDQVRRVYPPYWTDEGRAGHCPKEVTWLSVDGNKVGESSNYDDIETLQNERKQASRPPIAEHWKHLLKGLDVSSLRHVEDDRMMGMSYIAISKPASLTKGDFVRLGGYNKIGSFTTLPYSSKFLENFEQEYCYDRFWDVDTQGHSWMNTRYVITEHSFVVIGDYDDKKFFTKAHGGVLAHFRHHYFLMVLINRFHRASLLAFQDRIADALTKGNTSGKLTHGFRREMETIQSDFLRFTQRYWFPEITSQLQGREMFALMQKHSGTKEMYDQLIQEIGNINQALNAKAQERQAQEATTLSRIATYGLGISFVLATLAIPDFTRTAINWDFWRTAIYISLFWSVVMILLRYGMSSQNRNDDDKEL
jgi:hypothetical protein